MTTTFKISGMTCEACKYKIEHLISTLPAINTVKADIITGLVQVDSSSDISAEVVKELLKPYTKYSLVQGSLPEANNIDESSQGFFVTYKPILILFGYLLLVSGIAWYTSGVMWAMNVFMGAFFLAFSFFKMLDVKSFAESYAMYDIIAMKWNGWGYVYVFVELMLGIAYITHFDPVITNSATILVMGVSIIGVINSVLDKRKIKCACLGSVFNLPMSTLTIVEDGIMLIMSVVMLAIEIF